MDGSMDIGLGKANVKSLPGRQLMKISESTNILDIHNLFNIQIAFPRAPGIDYHLSQPQETTLEFNKEHAVAIHAARFANGLRLPLYPFIVMVLNAYKLVPAQLTLEFIGYIISFIIQSEEQGLPSSLPVFSCCFELIPKPYEWGFYLFKPQPDYQVCRIQSESCVWRRKFILVTAANWEISTTPSTPVPAPNWVGDWLLNQERDTLKTFFVSCNVIPHFQHVVTLESLEQHIIARIIHSRFLWKIPKNLYDVTCKLNESDQSYRVG
ncbi:hypothetical protein Dimus_037912 [Dionaea muscipula]